MKKIRSVTVDLCRDRWLVKLECQRDMQRRRDRADLNFVWIVGRSMNDGVVVGLFPHQSFVGVSCPQNRRGYVKIIVFNDDHAFASGIVRPGSIVVLEDLTKCRTEIQLDVPRTSIKQSRHQRLPLSAGSVDRLTCNLQGMNAFAERESLRDFEGPQINDKRAFVVLVGDKRSVGQQSDASGCAVQANRASFQAVSEGLDRQSLVKEVGDDEEFAVGGEEGGFSSDSQVRVPLSRLSSGRVHVHHADAAGVGVGDIKTIAHRSHIGGSFADFDGLRLFGWTIDPYHRDVVAVLIDDNREQAGDLDGDGVVPDFYALFWFFLFQRPAGKEEQAILMVGAWSLWEVTSKTCT